MRKILTLISLGAMAANAFASNVNSDDKDTAVVTPTSKSKSDDNTILSYISPLGQNYILPGYYSKNPVQNGVGPGGVKNKNTEVMFQISFKAGLWTHMFGSNLSWYASYTQKSFWQAYSPSAFFRETNYTPASYLQYDFKYLSMSGGFVHQSNGRGGELERSWNRVFANIKIKTPGNHFMLDLMPWKRVDSALGVHDYNPDITDYLGYGKTILSFQERNVNLSVTLRNLFESHFKRGYVEATFSFPIFKGIRGMILASTGYGDSLIEYNHYDTSIGIGLDLTDYLFGNA